MCMQGLLIFADCMVPSFLLEKSHSCLYTRLEVKILESEMSSVSAPHHLMGGKKKPSRDVTDFCKNGSIQTIEHYLPSL